MLGFDVKHVGQFAAAEIRTALLEQAPINLQRTWTQDADAPVLISALGHG